MATYAHWLPVKNVIHTPLTINNHYINNILKVVVTKMAIMQIFNIDGLVQERRNSNALAVVLVLSSCTNPSIWYNGDFLTFILLPHSDIINKTMSYMSDNIALTKYFLSSVYVYNMIQLLMDGQAKW